jgi:putative MATE family efflux protein
MKDMTEGSIARHLIAMAAPMTIGMLVQTLYFLVDLYFVARLGGPALAGVSAGGSFSFAVLALTQMLGVGTVTLISHAVGAKDRPAANLIFNQSLALAALCSIIVLVGGYALAGPYMRSLGADPASTAAGITYLTWYLPGLALQFAMVAMSSALRATGLAQPTMIAQLATVVVNIVLAPILIGGFGTGHPFGVAGAGLASTLSVAAGTVLLSGYFRRLEKYVAWNREEWRPRLATWKRILDIGLPAGGEFGLMFVSMAVSYYVIRDFGAAAQAGYGIGSRLMQAIFLPAMAISFAVAPVAGQNFGARRADRVRRTFRDATLMSFSLMAVLTVLCHWESATLVGYFTHDAETRKVGTEFLRVVSLNFVASGLVFSCSGMFQALGNTWPSILSSALRLVTYTVPALIWSRLPGFALENVWHLSVATMTLQACLSLWLLRRQLAIRLAFTP